MKRQTLRRLAILLLLLLLLVIFLIESRRFIQGENALPGAQTEIDVISFPSTTSTPSLGAAPHVDLRRNPLQLFQWNTHFPTGAVRSPSCTHNNLGRSAKLVRFCLVK